jgi:hypothetical protein
MAINIPNLYGTKTLTTGKWSDNEIVNHNPFRVILQ